MGNATTKQQEIPGIIWCPICMEWKPPDYFRVLQCGHCFCNDCMDEWLTQQMRCCPLCKEEHTGHFQDIDSIEGQLYLPEAPDDETAEGLQRLIYIQIRRRNQTVHYMRVAAEQITNAEFTGAGFKIGGSVGGIIGAGMVIVGTSLSLSGVGAVAGVPMAIAGAAIGGAGGLNVAGAIIAESAIKSKNLRGVNEHLQRDYFHSEQLRILIGRAARDDDFAGRFDVPPEEAFSLLGMFGKVAKFGTSVGALARGVALGVGRGAATAGLHIAGMVLSSALIPIDIAQMIISSIKIHKRSVSDVVVELKNLADKMEEEVWALLHEDGYRLCRSFFNDGDGNSHVVIFAIEASHYAEIGNRNLSLEELHDDRYVILVDEKGEVCEQNSIKLSAIWSAEVVARLIGVE